MVVYVQYLVFKQALIPFSLAWLLLACVLAKISNYLLNWCRKLSVLEQRAGEETAACDLFPSFPRLPSPKMCGLVITQWLRKDALPALRCPLLKSKFSGWDPCTEKNGCWGSARNPPQIKFEGDIKIPMIGCKAPTMVVKQREEFGGKVSIYFPTHMEYMEGKQQSILHSSSRGFHLRFPLLFEDLILESFVF